MKRNVGSTVKFDPNGLFVSIENFSFNNEFSVFWETAVDGSVEGNWLKCKFLNLTISIKLNYNNPKDYF